MATNQLDQWDHPPKKNTPRRAANVGRPQQLWQNPGLSSSPGQTWWRPEESPSNEHVLLTGKQKYDGITQKTYPGWWF